MLVKGLLLATLLPAAFADVQFTSPAAGTTIAGGKPLAVKWKDSGDGTALTDLSTYTLFLCAGGNDAASFIQLAPINPQGKFSTGNEASAPVAVGLGGPDKNAYFLKMISIGAKGAQVINYSDRFTLSGMTGTFPPNVKAGIAAVSGTAGPSSSSQEAPEAAGGDGEAMSYAAQQGPIKYAPMLTPPGPKITKKAATPRYPTSKVSIAHTFLPPPKQSTTITASATNVPAQSRQFQAAAASMPVDDMQKFLHRWRD